MSDNVRARDGVKHRFTLTAVAWKDQTVTNVTHRTFAPVPCSLSRQQGNPEYGLAVLIYLLASFLPPSALILLGLDYATAGGDPFEKIHPATYCAIFGLLALVFAGRGPVYRRQLTERKGLLFYLLSWLALQAYAVIFLSTPLSATIDTFLLPGLLFLVLSTLTDRNNAKLATLLDAIMTLNSVLAICELISGFHLIPSATASASAGVIIFANEWRPSAFMGHPLTGAAVTGAYCLILLSNYRIKSNWRRFALLALNGCALLAYGGRMALATTVFCAACYLGANGLRLLGNRPIRRNTAAALFLGPPVVVLSVVFLFEYGFLDKFIERMNFDNGSAESRVVALQMFTHLPITSLIHGLSDREVLDVTTRYGVTTGIESFWLSFVLRYGLIGCVIFFPGLFVFTKCLVNQTQAAVWLIILYFFITISLSVSISSKNLSLVFVTAFILCNYRKNEHQYQSHENVTRGIRSRSVNDVRWQTRAVRPAESYLAARKF